MHKLVLLLLGNILINAALAQQTPFELSKGKETATYEEAIEWFRVLDEKYPEARLLEEGGTDIGKPLHLFILSKDQVFEPADDKLILLINNGIHPGEPEGIDASMMLARDMLGKKSLPENVIICIVPVYNVGGALNRNRYSRANQDGPESYGFRGNARNLDLNRDFIKADSKNSRSFQKLFQRWKPHVLLDNHTTNGADYQHVITYIASQKNKLQPALAEYMTGTLNPKLNQQLTDRGFPPVPYVDTKGDAPETGLIGFYDCPRYSTGYAALFNTIGYVLETHMLKPFDQRVLASYAFMEELIEILNVDYKAVLAAKRSADASVMKQRVFPLHWELDTATSEKIEFRGYEASYKTSALSGKERLYYDTDRPFVKQVPWYNEYKPAVEVKKPAAYILPQAWGKAVKLLELNGVQLIKLEQDTVLEVEVYYLEDYKSPARPYEGHYLHSGLQLRKEKQKIKFYKGDYRINTNQPSVRYIIEMLEPQGVDSYFAWNFFDSVLGQKEYFSAYVFEDLAADLLKQDKELKKKFEEKKENDTEFAGSGAAQLDYIYRHSPYYEKSHLRYPVYRVE